MPEGDPAEPLTVVLVDDAEDVRFLTKLALERTGAFTVVAEGADGAEVSRRSSVTVPT